MCFSYYKSKSIQVTKKNSIHPSCKKSDNSEMSRFPTECSNNPGAWVSFVLSLGVTEQVSENFQYFI